MNQSRKKDVRKMWEYSATEIWIKQRVVIDLFLDDEEEEGNERKDMKLFGLCVKNKGKN